MASLRGQFHRRFLPSTDRYCSFTVYVDNLPNGVGIPWFYKFFSNFGLIKEVYLPNRRSKRTGYKFGFVRYVSSNEAHQAVAKGNGIWIGKRHLIVERALYDKVLPKVGFSEVKGRSNSIFRIGKQNQEHNGDGDILPHRKEIEKRYTLNIQPIASEWLTRSAVAKLKVFTDPNCVQKAFIDLNFTEVRVKSLGGMNLIITFQSKEDRLSAIQNPLMTNWFSFFKPWNGEVAGISRLIWLNCRGMPLSVWNALTFKNIGALWGDFITLDVPTLKEDTYEVGRMIIATECNHKIDEWINITVKGRNHKVRVWEEDCNNIFSDNTIREWVQKQQLMSLIPQSSTIYQVQEKDKVWRKKQFSVSGANQSSSPNHGSEDEPRRDAEVEGNKNLMGPLIFSELSDKQDNLENGSLFMTFQKAEGQNLDVIQEEGEVSKVGETPDLGLNILASGSCNVNDDNVVAVKALEVVGATTCPNVILLGDNVEHGGLGKQAFMVGAINSPAESKTAEPIDLDNSISSHGLEFLVEDSGGFLLAGGHKTDKESEERNTEAHYEDEAHFVNTEEDDNHVPIKTAMKGLQGKKKRKTINEILGFSKVNTGKLKGRRSKNKCVVLRSAVAAAALSASISSEGINNRNRILLDEARTIWEINKMHGIGYDGDEEEVISKIAEMEAKNGDS